MVTSSMLVQARMVPRSQAPPCTGKDEKYFSRMGKPENEALST